VSGDKKPDVFAFRDCWEENPLNRPDFKIVKLRVKEMEKGRCGNAFSFGDEGFIV